MTYSNSWHKKEYLLGLGGLGGGAGGILIAGGPIISSSDDGYQISKSLRFEPADSTYLQATTSGADPCTWTFSTWVKRGGIGNIGHNQTIFDGSSEGNNQSKLHFSTSDNLQFYTITGGSFSASVNSIPVFKDPSAWYHVVCAYDSHQDVQLDRIKLYVNGVQITYTNDNGCEQHQESHVDSKITIGAAKESENGLYGRLQLADTQFIDGVQLTPAAFGIFDANTGAWNPKSFAMPTPNNDEDGNSTTWSNYLKDTDGGGPTLTDGSLYPLSNCFDGDATSVGAMSYANGMVFTPPNPITFSNSVEVLLASSIGAGSQGYIATISGAVQTQVDLVEGSWGTIYSGSGTLDKLVITRNAGGSNNNLWIYGLRIDGVILVDGQTDSTTRNNLNTGRVWSSDLTKSVSNNWNNAPSYSFTVGTGSASIYDPTDGDDYTEWAPSPAVSYTGTVELWVAGYPNGRYSLNGGAWTAIGDSESLGFQSIATGSGSITNLKFKRVAQGGYSAGNTTFPSMVKVDGHVLRDSKADTSFHLKYNDTSRNSALGKDTLNGKIADATGALPIYNTSDDWGEVKGSGNRTDSLSGNLKLAIAGDSVSSTAMDVSSADHDVTVDGVTVSTDESRLYGSSLLFESANTDRLTVEHADMAFGTGDLCVEFWVYNLTNKNYNSFAGTRETANATEAGFVIASDAEGHLYVHSNAALAGSYTSEHVLPLNTWTHVAYTRASGTHRLFMNGVAAATASTTSRTFTEDKFCIGDNSYAQDEPINAYMQDIRVYKGAAKYTANFKPPTRNDYAVNNLTEADSSNPENIDSLTDTPTNYGTDTGLGGEVRGTFCTWNPLMTGDSTTQAFSQGNLEWKNTGVDAWTGGTLGVKYGSSTTNKWYWEVTIKHGNGGYGICTHDNKGGDHSDWGGGTDRSRFYLSSNGKLANPAGGSDLTYGSNTTSAVDDVIGVALDLSPGSSNGTITFYKNGTTLGQAHSDIDTSKYWTTFICDYGGDPKGGVLNTGQRPFKYTAPTDHKCLCTANLLDTFGANDNVLEDKNAPSKYFDIKTYTGIGADHDIKGVGFNPDFLWIKRRNTTQDHIVFDKVRGFNGDGDSNYLFTNSNAAETHLDDHHLKTFNSDGFTLMGDSGKTNISGGTYVSWMWDAGTAFSNSAGTNSATLASEGRYNADAGFAIVKYTGGGWSPGTGVYHPLGAVPGLIIHKRTDGTSDWEVYTTQVDGSYDMLKLNSTAAKADSSQTAPTSTLFNSTWSNGQESIAYLWTPIAGYSAFGSYEGNNTTTGTFVYTGFRPRWLLTHCADNATGWAILDTKRDIDWNSNHGSTGKAYALQAQTDAAEDTSSTDINVDILSNGFKPRTSWGPVNSHDGGSGTGTMIYAAFAEQPFKVARAR